MSERERTEGANERSPPVPVRYCVTHLLSVPDRQQAVHGRRADLLCRCGRLDPSELVQTA